MPDEAVQAELDRLREGFASLSPSSARRREGDILSLDYRGTVDGEPFEGGEGQDQLVELGSGSLVDGFEEGLIGASAGDERTIEVTFPDDYRATELAGKDATFEVTVKEVREKELPELDDDFAADASEFETLDELRDEIRAKLAEALERRADEEFRGAAVATPPSTTPRSRCPSELADCRAPRSRSTASSTTSATAASTPRRSCRSRRAAATR